MFWYVQQTEQAIATVEPNELFIQVKSCIFNIYYFHNIDEI